MFVIARVNYGDINMQENMTLNEFLSFISNCDGDEAIELISKFQEGGLTIEHLGAEDFD